MKLVWICCVQRVPNGNTVVGNWFQHKRRADGTPFFEVTPDKAIVWRATMHERMFDPAAIQILDVEDYVDAVRTVGGVYSNASRGSSRRSMKATINGVNYREITIDQAGRNGWDFAASLDA